MDLAGRVALVTGGASGLGEATARLLASGGARVAVLDRNAAQGQRVAAEIGGLACETDVASESSVAAALEKIHAAWGALHVTVNCAGIATAKRMLGKEGPIALGEFERVITVNLIGTFNVCRLAAAIMAKNQPDEEPLRLTPRAPSREALAGEACRTSQARWRRRGCQAR